MRAAVGQMITHGGDPIQSKPDYYQSVLHHGCLLVLLRGVGPSKPRSLQRTFEKIRRVNNVKITDSSGLTRNIWVRYIHDHPVENNDWGDFQTHRRLLGLITVGKFDTQTELNELCRQHESLKVRYSSTLFNSRAVFFGPSKSECIDQPKHATKGSIAVGLNTQAIIENGDEGMAASEAAIERLQDEYTTPTNFKAVAYFYRDNDSCADLEPLIAEFVSSLFWVLESKRLERSREKADKVSMLYAPFEKRDFVGFDMESRSNRKRCVGRVTKNLADLSLQVGLVEDALGQYHSACETLRAIHDSLWLGAAEEGLCAASAILLYPQLRETETLRRNISLQEGSSPLRNAQERWRASDATTKVSTHDAAKTQSEAPVPSASSSCSSVSSILTNSTASGASSPTTNTTSSSNTSTATLSPGKHRVGGGSSGTDLPGNILKPDEIPLHYRNAIIDYSKYSLAAIVETEAGFKAARICVEQNKPLEVAMFLQNILYISMTMSEPERVRRLEVITDLYQQIGYRRRAAFFQRLAALKYVQQGNPNPDWAQTYRLLLTSFSGYLLALDPLEVIDNAAGWPVLQIDLLQSLIAAARRLGHSALATRHMTFLLQTQWQNMAAKEQSEMAVQLQNLSAQCEGSPVPLVLEDGTVIPPANLTDVPFCEALVVRDLPAQLRPQRIKVVKADSGPFLFTPLHFSSLDRRDKRKDKNKIGFFWVQNQLSEVNLSLRNPLPFELTVSDMRLLTNGVVFEALAQTVVLPPHMATLVTLHGQPIEAGQLEVQGYSTHTLGVKSNCRLKHMRGRGFPPNFIVDVIPALPFVSVTTSLPQTTSFSSLASSDLVVTSASLTLYAGESTTFVITVANESALPVEHLEVAITANVEQALQYRIFRIDEQEVQAQLPLAQHRSLDLTVHVYAEAEFVCPTASERAGSTHSSSTLTHDFAAAANSATAAAGPQSLQYSTVSCSGQASLPSRVGSPNHMRRMEPSNVSFRSTISSSTAGGVSLGTPTPSMVLPQSQYGVTGVAPFVQHIEAQLRLKYSGGEAMRAGYCRQCAVAFSLEVLPSAQITSWDVLPAEVPSQFYLVLDVSNLTAQEMSLNYTDTKSILIEAKESCRVPISVGRCSLDQVVAARQAEHAENMEKELCFRTQLLSFNESIGSFCSAHIAKSVHVKWTLTGSDVHGVASLRGITLSPAMIDLTTESPLRWTVHFQNAPMQPQSEVVCTAGQSAILSVSMSNQSTQTLRNLVLTVKFYQDYLNGMENYNLETRVALSGPSRVSIPALRSDETVHHDCTVIFFTPGRFKTSIQCHSKPQAAMTTGAGASVVSASFGAGNAGNWQTTLDFDATGGYHEHQEHVWKFIPPIEVTVTEQ